MNKVMLFFAVFLLCTCSKSSSSNEDAGGETTSNFVFDNESYMTDEDIFSYVVLSLANSGMAVPSEIVSCSTAAASEGATSDETNINKLSACLADLLEQMNQLLAANPGLDLDIEAGEISKAVLKYYTENPENTNVQAVAESLLSTLSTVFNGSVAEAVTQATNEDIGDVAAETLEEIAQQAIEGDSNTDTDTDTSSGTSTQTVRFSFTGSTQDWVVPTGVTNIEVKVWGAAGGGVSTARGGAGGYAGDTSIAVTEGETITIIVGEGGAIASTGGWPGAGNGGTGCAAATAAGGGGKSGIYRGTTPLIIAGGGGGAGTGFNGSPLGGTNGGDGGGLAAIDADYRGGVATRRGFGGITDSISSCSGGVGGDGSFAGTAGVLAANPTAGTGGNGGCGEDSSIGYSGGGGGDGLCGGGGGSGNDDTSFGGAGGGGSGYADGVDSTLSQGSAGTAGLPGNETDTDRTTGIGEAVTNTAGGNGEVIIFYVE